MAKHMIVVSIDALVYEDLEYARTLPNFAKILDNGAIIERVRTIYPSLTHPVHATLITGATAGKTGVISNEIFSPGVAKAPWYNNLDQIKCDTLLHAAKRAGLSTATASWPMTSYGSEVIDYFVPCALNADFVGYEDRPLDAYRHLGAGECVMDIIEKAVELYGWENTHPEVDAFQIYCSQEIIKRFKPNLLLTHPSYVDSARHRNGVFGERVKDSIRVTDEWLGMLFDAVREAGIEDETDFIILSDHGQINITRVISPNVYFCDAGYIKADSEGSLLFWNAYVKGCGASAQVFLSKKDDKELYDGVYKLLTDMRDEGIYGIERVYTREEAMTEYGLYGDFSFVIEGDGYTSFGEYLSRPSVRGFDFTDYRFGRGTHGHAPEKGPQPTFAAIGPSFKQGVSLAEGNILNHAPTLAKALGVELRDADGKAVEEILK